MGVTEKDTESWSSHFLQGFAINSSAALYLMIYCALALVRAIAGVLYVAYHHGESVADAANLAARSSSATGDTERSETATRAAMVLSDLFQRADKRAGELAKAYDASRIAGLACKAAYSGMRFTSRMRRTCDSCCDFM